MKPDVLVLGAGMIGTCTALQLALRGHSVALLDRREPGRETSYGNAGLIQCEAVEPYPFPQDPAMLLRVALKRGADVNYHLGAMPSLASPLGQYWANSRGERYQQIAIEYGRLSSRSVTEHAHLIDMAGASDLVRRDGYRMVFRTQAGLEEAVRNAERLHRDAGVNFRAMTGEQLAAAEPALRQRLAGAVHWTDPWSVADPGELVQRYADAFVQRGGSIIDLTAREWAVFEAFVQRPSALLSKSQLEERLYAFGAEIESNTIEVYVSRLRKKLGRELIETVRGMGYRLAPPSGVPS